MKKRSTTFLILAAALVWPAPGPATAARIYLCKGAVEATFTVWTEIPTKQGRLLMLIEGDQWLISIPLRGSEGHAWTGWVTPANMSLLRDNSYNFYEVYDRVTLRVLDAGEFILGPC